MRFWPKSPKGRRTAALVLTLVLAVGLLAAFWDPICLFIRPDPSLSKILVLDDYDPDFRNPPFEDVVLSFTPRGRAIRKVKDLNICETVGGGRSLSVAPDGRFFVVCENVGKHLIAYDTQSGKQLWIQGGEYTAATIAPDGMTYAVISAGTIYGDQTVLIDRRGQIVKQAKVGGFDLAVDPYEKVVWLVGANIKQCDLELNVLHELDPIPWCASSVDVNPDGTIWLAEREHSQVSQSTNRLFKISRGGVIKKTIDLGFSPFCLRVDRSDGNFWVTGAAFPMPATARLLEAIEKRTGRLPIGKRIRDFLTRERVSLRTHNYDAEGKLLQTIKDGGHTIEIDPADGSVWLAGRGRISHYSRTGARLCRLRKTSGSQEYIAIVTVDLKNQ
jgi:hypothetical protein